MKINSNDQLDIKGACLSNCLGKSLTYSFSLYKMDNVFNTWTLFTNKSYFYTTGHLNSYLVVLKDLFRDFPSQIYWKVELNINVTTFKDEIFPASSSIIFYVNFSPCSGLCTLNPLTGTTNTVFSISCFNWIDLNGQVLFYSYYGKFLFFLEGWEK